MRRLMLGLVGSLLLAATLSTSVTGQDPTAELDARVRAFLDRHRGTWRDLNVSESDGRVLHDLILEHKFSRALEIGTSTGHSGIWIAWALAKTGGRLTTVEIDQGRHRLRSRTSRQPGSRRMSMRASGTRTLSCPRSPARLTSCSRTPTRSGTRTTSSRSGRSSCPKGASRPTTCRAGGSLGESASSWLISRPCPMLSQPSTRPAVRESR